jgi:hypothetical protein
MLHDKLIEDTKEYLTQSISAEAKSLIERLLNIVTIVNDNSKLESGAIKLTLTYNTGNDELGTISTNAAFGTKLTDEEIAYRMGENFGLQYINTMAESISQFFTPEFKNPEVTE